MKYCKLCLQNNYRPNTFFSKNGICPACVYYNSIKNEDWDSRIEILKDIINKHTHVKKKKGFDCIIGVSGGKDSTRQALWVRDKLGLKPLLACLSYPPEQVSIRGTNNISNLINLGFDVVISSPAPLIWKKLMRLSFLKLCNWAKSTELALFSFVPQLAIRYNISLIFWGENPGLQLGDLKSKSKYGYDGKNLRYLNTLASGKLDWLPKKILDKNYLFPYQYPSLKEFKKNRIKIIYLGWFWKDWSLKNNAYNSIVNGLEIREPKYKNYGDLYRVTSLDEDWVTINQLIKYYKYGFGRATDYINEEIRAGKISREDGIKIVEKYDGKYSNRLVQSFCNYINIEPSLFWSVVKKNLNKKLFLIKKNKIIPKFKVGKDFYK
jgi:N-acetyl sugar amidotransferase